MKVVIKDYDPYFIGILMKAISRKGYTVNRNSETEFGIANLESYAQEGMRNMVAQLCEHYGREYEIVKEVLPDPN